MQERGRKETLVNTFSVPLLPCSLSRILQSYSELNNTDSLACYEVSGPKKSLFPSLAFREHPTSPQGHEKISIYMLKGNIIFIFVKRNLWGNVEKKWKIKNITFMLQIIFNKCKRGCINIGEVAESILKKEDSIAKWDSWDSENQG